MSLESTKADEIALTIEEAIVSGELPPGTVLRQEQLSERFAVSRTPIREALRRLAALGLVSFVPNRGVRVRTLSRDELREAFLVRAELESLATELAAPKMTEDDLAELEEAEARFSEATQALRARPREDVGRVAARRTARQERAAVVLGARGLGPRRLRDRRPLRAKRPRAPRDHRRPEGREPGGRADTGEGARPPLVRAPHPRPRPAQQRRVANGGLDTSTLTVVT
jgi:DNA-binding transcriptional MocR family regulator